MRLTVLFFILLVSFTARAQNVDIEFILDASGSMSAQLQGQSQMEIAKKSIEQTLPTIPPNTPVALRVYAHRVPQSDKTKSCEDTELMVSFQPMNESAIKQALVKVQPKGYTPIAYSLKVAAGDFLGKESQHVLILLSDGEETCGGDPVSEAKNLLAQGFKLTIHTIGFRVDEKTRAQLKAISDATQGNYYDAQDSASLSNNLKQATQKALLISKPVEAVRGQEIRGGNQYEEAVLLKPDMEYRLDHHQKKNEFDYFYVDLKKGDNLTATVTTLEKGGEVNAKGEVREDDNPYAGMRIVDPQFQEMTSLNVIGKRHGKEEKTITAGSDGRHYLLVGNTYGSMMHKDSPFKISIKSQSDANLGKDAGDDLFKASDIPLGSYPENWLYSTKDNDYFRVPTDVSKTYSIVVSPQSMEANLKIEVYDADRVRLASQNAANAGAIIRVPSVSVKTPGTMTLGISGYGFDKSIAYSLEIKENAGP